MPGAEIAPVGTALSDPIDAWRTWTLRGSRDGTQVRLLPIAGTGHPWPPRLPVRAECARHRRHLAPGIDCTCGIHATHEPDPLRRTRDPAVLGTVALWGRVVEHELGYRAEHGYPQRLGLICPLCFWQWGTASPQAPEAVVRRRGGRLLPFCTPHLELARRSGYPVGRPLEAAPVERALLDVYAVDLLRPARRGAAPHSGGCVVR